jgi:hypothetical protein
MAYSLADAKANVADLYGNAARLVRDRDAQIQAGYEQITQQLKQNAMDRQLTSSQQAGAEQAGLNTAYGALGLQAPTPTPGGAASFRSADESQYTGDANGWEKYLGTSGGIQRDRNRAAADAFDYMGQKQQEALDAEYLMSLSRGFGGGGVGGRGRGGGGGGGEELIEYPSKVNQMTPGAARGLAATRLRLEKQGGLTGQNKAMPKNYTYSPKKNSNTKLRKAEAKSNRR